MLVNAMEVSGIEGNFRSTCENVMQVLRTNKDSVMAMMEVPFLTSPPLFPESEQYFLITVLLISATMIFDSHFLTHKLRTKGSKMRLF